MIEQLSKTENPQPLSMLQAYLVQVKASIALTRDVCLEFKELLVVVTMILFFSLGVYEMVKHLFK